MDEQLLKDFLETAKQNQYNWDVIMPKFPELEGIDLQLLKDYTQTAIDYNYDYDIINPKFPEFFGEQNEVKKKDESDFITQDQSGELVTEDISSDIPVYDFKKPQTEQDFFEGTFGDILRDFDKYTQIGLGDFVDDMARSAATGYYQGQVAEDASDILLRGANATDEDIYSFIEANKEAQKLGPSDEMMEYQKTYEENGKGFMGVVMGLYKSGFQVIPEVILSSIISMASNKDSRVAAGTILGAGATVGATTGAAGGTAVLPFVGTVTGAAGGAISGAAATLPYAFAAAGSVLEMGATFSELLQEEIEGELTPEKIREALNDDKIYTSLRNKALARGVTIGVIDAFTGRLGGRIAGKILSKAGTAATKGTKIKSVLAASGVESVGGSIGEAAGIGVTNIDTLGDTKGQDFDISEIALEGIAEAPGGIKDVISARFSKPKYKVNGKKVDVETIDNLIETMTLDQLQSTKITIDNDYEGRSKKLSDRILQLNTERLILDANPDINPETLAEITKLQLELSSLEGNKTEVAKEKASIIKAKIKDLQENQLEAEVDTEIDAFRELEQSEQLKYIEQASKELVEESEAKGDEEFEITEAQSLQRAVELFNKDQQTDTEVEVTSKEKTEVKEEIYKDSQIPVSTQRFTVEDDDGNTSFVEITTNLDGSRKVIQKIEDGTIVGANSKIVSKDNTLTNEEYTSLQFGDIKQTEDVDIKNIRSSKVESRMSDRQRKAAGLDVTPEAEVDVDDEVVYEMNKTNKKIWSKDFEILDNRQGQEEALFDEEGNRTSDKWWVVNKVTGQIVEVGTKSMAKDVIANAPAYAETFGDGTKVESNMIVTPAPTPTPKAEVKVEEQVEVETKVEPKTEQEIKARIKELEQVPSGTNAAMQAAKEGKPINTPEIIAMQEAEISAKEEIESLKEKIKQPRKQVTKVEKQVDNARKALNKLDKDIKIVIHNDDASYRKATGEETREQSTRGEYNPRTKTININATKVQDNTVAHEVFHALLLRNGITNKQAKAITDRMLNAVKKTASPELLQKLKEHSENYKSALQSEESIAELFGILASEYKSLDKPTQNLIQRWINKLAKILGVKKFTDAEVIDLLNVVSAKVEAGQEITEQDVKILGKNKSKISDANKRFQADFYDSFSGMTYMYDKNTNEFKQLKKDGYITTDKSITYFNGKYVFFHQPDAAFSGIISKNGEILVEGKGGMYYPIKFHKDGFFWASTDAAAQKMAEDLNKVLEQNGGTIYMALTSAPYDKLLSSTTMSNAVLDFFTSKMLDKTFAITNNETSSSIKKTLSKVTRSKKVIKETVDKKTGKKIPKKVTTKLEGLALESPIIIEGDYSRVSDKLPSSVDKKIKEGLNKIYVQGDLDATLKNIKEKLGAENSSFNGRKSFSENLINEMAGVIKNKPRAIKQFGKLFSEGIQNKYFKGITKTGKISISKANMIQALSEMLTEPILKDNINREKGGQIYAILEVNGKLKPVSSDKHESYPKALKSEGGVKINILTDRVNWSDVTEDFQTNEIVTEDRKTRIYPTSGVSVRGLKINTSNISKSDAPQSRKQQDTPQSRKQIIGENADLTALNLSYGLNLAKDIESFLKLTPEQIEKGAAKNVPIDIRFLKNKTPEELKYITGWVRGIDGKWRYELPDGKLTLRESGTFKLSDVYDSKDLYKAYPQLKDMKVEVDIRPLGAVSAWFIPSDKSIEINAKPNSNVTSLLVHEIQHAIQFIEGFATGGNMMSAFQAYENTVTPEEKRAELELKEEVEVLKKLSTVLEMASIDFEGMSLDEVLDLDFMQENFDALGLEEGGDAVNVYEYVNVDNPQIINKLKKDKFGYSLDLEGSFEEASFIAGEKQAEYSDKYSTYALYQRLAGEVEARNVEKRFMMTEEKRRKTLLSATEDVAREDQILLFPDAPQSRKQKSVSDLESNLEKKYNVTLDLYQNKDFLELDKIIVTEDQRNTGVGSNVMREVIDFANKKGLTIALTPSTSYGATSIDRLKGFYKGLGFVENKGINKDFTTKQSMLKLPDAPQSRKQKTIQQAARDFNMSETGFFPPNADSYFLKRAISRAEGDYGVKKARTGSFFLVDSRGKKVNDLFKRPQSRKQKPSKKPTRKRTSSIKKAITEIKNVLNITPDEQRTIFKALNDQKKIAKDIKKDIVASLRELTKQGKITPSKMVSVINKVPDDFNNPITVERFVEYMTKVFNDADYGNKMMIANAKKGKARKNASTKLGIAEGLVDQLQRLFSVKPSLIPDSVLDQYMELIGIFGKRESVLSLPPMEQVIQLTEDVLQQLDEEQSMAIELADRYENADKVMGDNGVDYAATIKEMLDNEVITEREYEVMKKYKSEIKPTEPATPKTKEEIEAERQGVIEDIKETKEVDPSVFPSRLERDLAKRFKKLLKTDAVNDLSLDDLKNLFKVIDNINNGYLPHYAQIMVGKMNAINDAKVGTNAINRSKLLPLSKIYANLKSKFGKTGKTPTLELIRRNPTFYIDQVFGDFKTKDIFNSIFKRSAEASAKYTKAIKEVQAKIEKVEQAVFKSFGRDPNKVIMSKYKQMSYLIQQEFLSNPDSKQVNSVEDFLKATIKRIKTETTSYTETDAKMLQDILDKYTANGTKSFDIDQLYESFNVAERNSIRALEEINKSMTERAVYTANIIRGNKITPLKNYTHLSVIPDVSKSDIIETETSQISDMFNKYLKPSTKAKSLIERTGKVSPLNFDVYASVQRGAKYTLMDFNLTEPIRTARRTINQIEKNLADQDGNIPVNARRKFNAIRDASVESIENLLSNALTQNTIFDEAVDYIQKQGYRAILAGVPRASYELLSNILAGIFIDPKGIISGIKNRKLLASPEGKEVMNNLNSTQTNRVFSTGLSGKFVDTGILNQAAGVTASRAKGRVKNTILKLWNKSGQRWVKGVEFTADSLISSPDKLVMQPMWFGAFENRFKQLTGKSPDFDKIAANDEAYMNKYETELNDAKTLADNRSVAMGATDNAFMGILKGTVKPNQGVMLRGFNAFNGFMTRFLIFEYITARTGIMAAVGNGQVSKKQGAALLAGVTTRMIAYTFMGTLVAESIKGLTEDDEEEDYDMSDLMFEDDDEQGMKSVDKMLGQAMASAFTSLLLGRDFGNATKSIINYGIEDFNERYGQFLRDGEYDKYRDAIQYTIIPEGKSGRPAQFADIAPNLFAAYSPMLKTLEFGVNKLFESDRVKPDAIERQQDERFIRLPLETFGVLGFIPFYKDVRKIVLANMYKGLRKAKKDAANKKKRKAEMLQGYSSETDMKRYDFPLWEKTFGPDSPGYDKRQAEKELKRKERKLRQQKKDKMYDYTPPVSKRKKQSSPFGPSGSRKGSSPFGPN